LILISIIYKWVCETFPFIDKRFNRFKWIDKPYKSLGDVRTFIVTPLTAFGLLLFIVT